MGSIGLTKKGRKLSVWAIWAFVMLIECLINAYVVFDMIREISGPGSTRTALVAAFVSMAVFAVVLIAVHRAMQREQTRYIEHVCDLVRLDGLTGLLNRTFFLDQIRADGLAGALLVADADHFKTINDTLGHYTGDAALIHLSKVIADAVEQPAIVGRLGGEEFGIFLPKADLERGIMLADHIRKQVEMSAFEANGNSLTLTLSIGVAAHLPSQPIGKSFKEADDNLYAAKRAGRNCVAPRPNAVREMQDDLAARTKSMVA